MSIQRYDSPDGDWLPSPDGDAVKFSDYERELAAKDAEIERLTKDRDRIQDNYVSLECLYEKIVMRKEHTEAENASLKAQVERLSAWQTSVLRRRGLSDAPCDVCGYNGVGYYQPSTHPCVSRAAKETNQGPRKFCRPNDDAMNCAAKEH